MNLLTEKAVVEFDIYQISAEDIADEIENIGFEAELLVRRALTLPRGAALSDPDPVSARSLDHFALSGAQEELRDGASITMTTARLNIGDMSCANCANSVELILKALPT